MLKNAHTHTKIRIASKKDQSSKSVSTTCWIIRRTERQTYTHTQTDRQTDMSSFSAEVKFSYSVHLESDSQAGSTSSRMWWRIAFDERHDAGRPSTLVVSVWTCIAAAAAAAVSGHQQLAESIAQQLPIIPARARPLPRHVNSTEFFNLMKFGHYTDNDEREKGKKMKKEKKKRKRQQ